MQITAHKVTDTGVYDGKEWLNFSRFGDKPNIEQGKAYEVAYKEFKGKKYIQTANVLHAGQSDAGRPAVSVTASTSGLTPDKRDRRILVQGILQAALQSPGLIGFAANADEYLASIETHTARLVGFVEKSL